MSGVRPCGLSLLSRLCTVWEQSCGQSIDTAPAVYLENPSLLPSLHLPLQRFQPETLGGVRRALQQGLSMQDGLSVWFPARCLSLPAFPLHFQTVFLSLIPLWTPPFLFFVSVICHLCHRAEFSVLWSVSLHSLADQHWSSGHNASPCLGMLVITGMRWNFSPWWNLFPQILFLSLHLSLFSRVAFSPVQPAFLSYCSHTPLSLTKEWCVALKHDLGTFILNLKVLNQFPRTVSKLAFPALDRLADKKIMANHGWTQFHPAATGVSKMLAVTPPANNYLCLAAADRGNAQRK